LRASGVSEAEKAMRENFMSLSFALTDQGFATIEGPQP
jgi:hypothetical protein